VLLRRDWALSTKVLEVVFYTLEVLEGMLCVLGLLEGVRRTLKHVENCAM